MITPSETFVFDDKLEWEQVGKGMKRKIMAYDQHIMLVKVSFDKGGVGELHEHYHSQTTYVVSGQFKLTIGNEDKIVRGGDAFYIPPHVEHGAVCLEDGVLIDVFSPYREDFLKN